MDTTRSLLRHFLATLAYRTRRATDGAPPGFGEFDAGAGVRTPTELLWHMTMLLHYIRRLFTDDPLQRPEPVGWDAEVRRFGEMLGLVDADLASGREPAPIDGEPTTFEQLLQGPLSDAMTHAGQLLMLRRLAGAPVPGENFMRAPIRAPER